MARFRFFVIRSQGRGVTDAGFIPGPRPRAPKFDTS